MALTATINGVAVSEVGFGVISKPETGPASYTGKLVLDDADDAPARYDILRIFDGATKLFAGPIDDKIGISGIAGKPTNAVEVDLVAHDFNVLATRQFLEPNWFLPAGTSVKDVATAIVGYIPGAILDPEHLDGPDISADMGAGKSTPAAASDWVTQDTGWRWRVREVEIDESLVLVYGFYDPESETAPFNIDEEGTYLDGDLKSTFASGDYANIITVYGDGATGTASDAGEISAKGPFEFQTTSQETDGTVLNAIAAVLLAIKLALWELAEVAYSTTQGGLEPGQVQDIEQPLRRVNGDFLITQVRITLNERAYYQVSASEGIVWRPGWRQLTREMFGGGSLGSLPGVGGGGGGGTGFVRSWMFFGGMGRPVLVPNAGDWVFVSDIEHPIDTVIRGTLSVSLVGRLRSLTPGVKVQMRLWNVDQGGPESGTSVEVTTPSADSEGVTPYTTDTFTVTVSAGSDRYLLQMTADQGDVFVDGIAVGW